MHLGPLERIVTPLYGGLFSTISVYNLCCSRNITTITMSLFSIVEVESFKLSIY